MRLIENLKLPVAALVVAAGALMSIGCAPEASTPTPKTPVSTGKPAAEAASEQNSSDKPAGAEVPAPADAEEGAADESPKEE